MPRIIIKISNQTLVYLDENLDKFTYYISTAIKGVGQTVGSAKTPAGRHVVRAKIGKDAPLNSVFSGRRLTGEIFTPKMLDKYPERDWILTRILWLSGRQPGFNRMGNVDTMRRYIYIHGTPYETQLGQPVSHGCVRMANKDVIELFDRVVVGCRVDIVNE